jgi:predicted  nucleic acid-binding Zn-ribbon protein
MKVTDIRFSAIAGEGASASNGGKHVTVSVSQAQAVKAQTKTGLFADLVQFAETILDLHEDASAVQVGWDETTKKVTVSPAETAAEVGAALDESSAEVADLQAQLTAAERTSAAKDKTIADLTDAKKDSDVKAAALQAKIAQLTKPGA